MSVAQSVAEVLRKHVVLEVESIDRMYLNVYVPQLQAVEGTLKFIRIHRGHKVASTRMVEPITRQFIGSIERFAKDNSIPLITFEKGQSKDDFAKQQRKTFQKTEGVVFIGKAQEKCRVYRTEKRRNPQTKRTYPWIVKSNTLVNHYYFYCIDEDFGPFFLKVCSYFPYFLITPSSASTDTNTSNVNWNRKGSPTRPWRMGFYRVKIPTNCNSCVTGYQRGRSMPYSANGCGDSPIPSPRRTVRPATAINSPFSSSNFPSPRYWISP
jgi:hypothetical protein